MHWLSMNAPHGARLATALLIASVLAIPSFTSIVLQAASTVESSTKVSSSDGLSEAPQISLNDNLYAISWGERAESAIGTADGALDANPGSRKILATGTSTKTQFPDIAVGADGTEHLTYITGNDIFYRHRTLGGSWSNAIKVASDNGPNPVRIAVAPNGTLWVIWRDADGTHLGFRYSDNGGAGWSAGSTNGIVYAESGNMYAFDIAIGPDNLSHVVWYPRTTGAANSGDIEYADWDGRRFNQGKITNDNKSPYDADPVISIDSDNVQHVAWRKQVGTGDTLIYVQRKPGGSWTGFTPLAQSGGTFQYSPGIGTDKNGSIYITFSQLVDGGRRVYIVAKPAGQADWSPAEIISDGFNNWETRNDVEASAVNGLKAHVVYQSEIKGNEATGEIYYKRVLYGPASGSLSAQPQIEAAAKTTKNTTVQVTFGQVAGNPTQVRWKWGATPTDQDNDSGGWQPFAPTKSIPLPAEITPAICRNLTLYTQVQNGTASENKAKSASILYDAAVQAKVSARNPHRDGKLSTYSQGASSGAPTNTRENFYDATIANLGDCSGLKEYGFNSDPAVAWPAGESEVVQRNTINPDYPPGVRSPLNAYVVDKNDNRMMQGAVAVYDPRTFVTGTGGITTTNSGAPVVTGGTFSVDSGNSVLRTLSFSDVNVNDAVYGTAASLPAGSRFWGVWVATSKGTAPISDTNSETLLWAPIEVAQPGASFTVKYPLLTGQVGSSPYGREGTYWIYVKFLDGAGNPSAKTLPPVKVELAAGYSLISQKLPSIRK